MGPRIGPKMGPRMCLEQAKEASQCLVNKRQLQGSYMVPKTQKTMSRGVCEQDNFRLGTAGKWTILASPTLSDLSVLHGLYILTDIE